MGRTFLIVKATEPKSDPNIPLPRCRKDSTETFLSKSVLNAAKDFKDIQEGRLIIAHIPQGLQSVHARSMKAVMRSAFASG